MAAIRRRNGVTLAVLVSVAAGMMGLAFASAPLYRLFCAVTGYGGTPKLGVAASAASEGRLIKVRFDANTDPALPWRFRPAQREITVRVGEEVLAYYTATNLASEPVTGRAVYNVTPHKIASYFGKIDCFCFTEQTLAPGAEVSMPVSFVVDPAIFADANTREVTAISLSYTFYRTADGVAAPDKTAASGAATPTRATGARAGGKS